MEKKDKKVDRPLTAIEGSLEYTEEMVADSYRSGVIEQKEMEPGELD